MASARKKQDSRREMIDYPVAALLEPCPHCDVSGGQYCRKRWGGRWIVAVVPHAERVALSRLGRP